MIFFSEDGSKVTHGVLFTHVFGIGVVVDWIFADPDFDLSHLILVEHALSDLDRPIDIDQPS